MTPSDRRKVLILGSGPNRIGQGIEFDYCCVHASFALGDAGFETVMLNCNPETVSTDYDTSDRLYFEPLTLEDALNVIEAEQGGGRPGGRGRGPRRPDAAQAGRVAARGAGARHLPGVDRRRRGPRAVERPVRPARDPAARRAARPSRSTRRSGIVERIGYPALLRPSYVLGGRAMEIVYDEDGPAPGHGGAGRLRQPRHRGRAVGRRGRCWSTGSSRTPPRSTSTPSATTPARSHRRGHGARRGGRGALRRLGLLDPAPLARRRHRRRHRGLHASPGRRPRRPGPPQRPVRGQAGPGVRHRGQPAGQPHGAVRGQGHRACRW